VYGQPAPEDAVVLGDEHLPMSAGVIEQGLHENSQNVIELGRMAIGDLLEEQVFLGVEVIDAGLEPVQGEDEGIL
jgi:hypothetical protein